MVVDKNLMMSSIDPLTTKQQGNFTEYSFMLQVVGTYKNTGLFIQAVENTFPLTRLKKWISNQMRLMELTLFCN